MYDPLTEAFSIRSPFVSQRDLGGWAYREPILTIWHCDPENHGDDDSCGFCFVRISNEDHKWAEETAHKEWAFWFSPEYGSINLMNSGILEITAAAWKEARHRADVKDYHKPLSAWEMSEIFHLCTNAGDNFGHLVAGAKKDEEGFARLLQLTLRLYLTRRRKWWQHPKFHIHHWRFQLHPMQRFNRWMFSRCAGCGGRFSWGYAPMSGWGGEGPQFLKGEKGVYHHECFDGNKKPCQ